MPIKKKIFNPFLPYGNPRNSDTSSRAIANVDEDTDHEFRASSLPRPLQGGLGRVTANGVDAAQTWMNQRKSHGLVEMPMLNDLQDVRNEVRGGEKLAKHIEKIQRRNPMPLQAGADDGREYVAPFQAPSTKQAMQPYYGQDPARFEDPQEAAYVRSLNRTAAAMSPPQYPSRSVHPSVGQLGMGHPGERWMWNEGVDPHSRTLEERMAGVIGDPRVYDQNQINQALNRRLDPTSEEYAAALTGRKIAPYVPGAASPAQDDVFAMPPNELGLREQIPLYDDAMTNPSAGQFMPTQNDGGFAPGLMPQDDLQNPFGPPELSRNDIPPGRDYLRDYNMGQYRRPQVEPKDDFYKMLDETAMAGMSNKTAMDSMRREDWQRDRDLRDYDQFAGGFMTPLAAMFVKDPATRARMMSGAGQQMSRYDQARQWRNSERKDQFAEDKFYTEAKMANDPNSFANYLNQEATRTNRLNAITGLQNSDNRAEYQDQIIQARLDALRANQEIAAGRLGLGLSREDRLRLEGYNRDQRARDNTDLRRTLGQGQLDARNRGLDIQQQNANTNSRYTDARIKNMLKLARVAMQRGDTAGARLALERANAIRELNRKNSNGEPMYAPEAYDAYGLERPAMPEEEPDQDILDLLRIPFAGLSPQNTQAPAKKGSNTKASPMNLAPQKPYTGPSKPTRDLVLKELKRRGLLAEGK